MRDISYRTWIARSLARALLADSDKPGGTRLAALQARAVATLGENPAWLASVITPLASLSPLRWQMLDIDALTEPILMPPQTRMRQHPHAVTRRRRTKTRKPMWTTTSPPTQGFPLLKATFPTSAA